MYHNDFCFPKNHSHHESKQHISKSQESSIPSRKFQLLFLFHFILFFQKDLKCPFWGCNKKIQAPHSLKS